ncbi:MAG: serine/threonine protein phosphatase [Gammaproteobacteria bacterium]
MSGRLFAAALAAALTFVAPPSAARQDAAPEFTIAVIPDTQNYLDFKRQRAAGFPFDASEMLMGQMSFIARNLAEAGGKIAFVTHVGDVWQHPTGGIDAAHRALGLAADPTNAVVAHYVADPRSVAIEMEGGRRALRLIAGKTPFSVVPGNHDYDAFWADSRFPQAPDPRNPGDHPTPYGLLHYGGLENFNRVFAPDSEFFHGQPWYVAHYNGGANSAQVFEAAGYRFLHIGLEMAPHDDVIGWAASVVERHRGLPTIVTIHDHLDRLGERRALPEVDFKKVNPEHNDPEDLWREFLSRHDQIFLVLSGHQNGQSRRVDTGAGGGKVWQLLADYQDRNQSLRNVDPDAKAQGGVGDGWLRLLNFDFSASVPRLQVRTWSTHFNAYARDLPQYAAWYKAHEQPQMTDAQFLDQEEFELELDDFVRRFGTARAAEASRDR